MLGELRMVQVVLNDLPEQVGGAAGDIPSLQGNISKHDNQVLKLPGVNAPIDPQLGHPHILPLEGAADGLRVDEVVVYLDVVEEGVHFLQTD